MASVCPHIQVGSFEVKAFSKLRTSLSSCLWGTMHTLELMALPFPKLFPSRAKFLLFGWEPVFPSPQLCSLCCSTSVTQLNGFSGGTTLSTRCTFHSAPRRGPWAPCSFYIWAQRLPGLPACTWQCGILCENL